MEKKIKKKNKRIDFLKIEKIWKKCQFFG
jgi:hypothetical protein